MTEEEVLALIAQMSGGKQNLSSSELSRLFSPYLGVLSGTYTSPVSSKANDDLLFQQYAPTVLQIIQNETDPNSLRGRIANAILQGQAGYIVKQMVQEAIRNQEPGLEPLPEGEQSKVYYDLVDTLENEVQKYNTAKVAEGQKETIFSKAGLPDPSERYAPEQLDPKLFEQMLKIQKSAVPKASSVKPVGAGQQNVEQLKKKYLEKIQSGEIGLPRKNIFGKESKMRGLSQGGSILNPGSWIAEGVDILGEITGIKDKPTYKDYEKEAERLAMREFAQSKGGGGSLEAVQQEKNKERQGLGRGGTPEFWNEVYQLLGEKVASSSNRTPLTDALTQRAMLSRTAG